MVGSTWISFSSHLWSLYVTTATGNADFLDNDSAGKIATDKALTALNQKCIVSVIQLPGGYKDVQDIKEAEVLTNVIKTRSLW